MIKNNPTVLLKVPENSFARCNQQGVLKDYLIYLKLKAQCIDGAFICDQWHTICTTLNLSVTMLRKYIKRLKDLGWLIKQEKHYQLISYDKLWKQLGYQLKDTCGIKGFKIFKIDTTNLNQLDLKIIVKEIKTNFLKQEASIIKAQKKKIASTTDSVSIARKLCKNLRKSFDRKRYFKYQLSSIRNHKLPLINFDITLTCAKLALLLGYKTAMSGYYIEQRLKSEELASIVNRKLLIMRNIPYVVYQSLGLSSCYSYKEGNLYKQLPNLISFLS